MVVEPLSQQDLDNMRLCLRLKVEQHPELARRLVDTKEEFIVEDCTKRQRGSGLFWGAARDGVPRSEGTHHERGEMREFLSASHTAT